MPIIKQNVYSSVNRILNNCDDNLIDPATSIYSDCFTSYQITDFNKLGYILNK